MPKELGTNTYREIYLQPQSFEAVSGTLEKIYAVLDEVFAEEDAYDKVIFTGCGTSFYLAQSAAHIFTTYTGKAACAVPCSELYFFPELHTCGTHTLVVPITRKSITTEVRMAIDKVREIPSVTTLSITCDAGSAAYNDYMVLSPDADEASIVMTRSYTSMLYLVVVMSMYLAGQKIEAAQAARIAAFAEQQLPVMDALAKKIVQEHPHLNLYITLGQGEYYGVACESMNKMKEMGLTHSEAYYSLEYRHGPMSIVDRDTLVMMFAHSKTAETDAKLMEQMKSFGAVTAVLGEDVSRFGADYSLVLALGLGDACLAPVVSIIGQLMGYHIACQKGLDADQPRNLSQAIVL